MDKFDETVEQLVSFCNSSVVRRPVESEWLVRRSLLNFRKQQLEQYDMARKAGAVAQQQAAQHHAEQQALLLQEIGRQSMQRELEAEFQGLRKNESQLAEQCQLQRQELQHAEQLLTEARSEREARPKEEPLVIERYLRTALGNEKKALQDERARSSNMLREQEKMWQQRLEALRKENEKELQDKKLQVETHVKKEQLEELKAQLKDAHEESKKALTAKDREWQERYARAQERAQERMLQIQVSEMDELQAINDANMEALKAKHMEELDKVEEEMLLLRKAEAAHSVQIQKAHTEHQEAHERDCEQIAELTSALARSRIKEYEDGSMSSPSKRARLRGPAEDRKPAASTPPTVRRRLTSKKRVVGAETEQRITLAGPLASTKSAPSTPAKDTTRRSSDDSDLP